MNFRTKLLLHFYGAEILEALALDEILKMLQKQEFTSFNFNRIPDQSEKGIQKDLYFLESEGFVKKYSGNSYSITKKGDLKLASGGFITDAKTSKNALFAFRISIVAISISIITFLVSLFSD